MNLTKTRTAVLLLDPLITQARLRPDDLQARSYPDGYRVYLDHPDHDNGALPYPQSMSTMFYHQTQQRGSPVRRWPLAPYSTASWSTISM